MGVKVAKLWLIHMFAFAVYFLAPPMGRHFVNMHPVQPILPEEPEQGVDLSTDADVLSLLQVGLKVSPGNAGPPSDNPRTVPTEVVVSQQKREHANVQATNVAVWPQRKGNTDVHATEKSPQIVGLRPNFGSKPEIIDFGLYVKNFFGMTVSQNQFVVDVVLTLHWTDPRVSTLVPAGLTNVTISLAEAKKNMWMPDIVVANRAISGQEHLSAAVEIYKDGSVVKTERSLLRVKQHFDVSAFPFDHQAPKVIVNSATLMAEDLELRVTAEKNWKGAKPGLFGHREFLYISDNTTVFEDVDGNLKKSRGMYVIKLRRDWTRYLQTTILPEIFLILISFTVFWMPRATPFAMPRVATNLISFLTLMTLSINTSKMLPQDREGMAWIELFADSMQMQNSLILFLNVFVDWVYFTEDLKELGENMTNQLAFLFPLMGTVVVLMCFMDRSGENLDRLANWIRLWMFGVQGSWICYSIRRVREENAKHAEAKS